MKRPFLIILFILIFSMVYLQNSINTLAENNYLLSDNKEKQFISAREFLQSGKLTGYSQYKNADINFQQKLLYKDLNRFIKSNVNDYFYTNLINIYSNPNNSISPNRQVYFFCSILDNDKTFKYKFIILDAETSKPLREGYRKGSKQTN